MNPEREQKVSAWKMMKSFYRAVEATWHEGQVSQEEADRRAAICAQCPKNTEKVTEFCIGCYARSLVSKVNDLLGSKRTAHDEKLKVCAMCHCDLKLKTWIPKSGVVDKTIDWPSHCWVRE
jgi:protein-arginine kinase activator protein McsA